MGKRLHRLGFAFAALVLASSAACGAAASSDQITTPPKETTAKPGSPRTASLVGDPITAAVASAVSVSVKILDSINVPVPNAVVNFVVTAGGGSVFAPAVASSAAGLANQQWTLGTKAGVQTVEARWIDPASGAARVLGSIAATATPGALSKFGFVGGAGQVSAVAGSQLLVDSVVKWNLGLFASDQYNNSLPLTGVAYSTTGAASLNGSQMMTTKVGVGRLVATLGSFSASTEVTVVDDMKAFKLRVSYSCLGGLGAGNADDSLVYQATGTLAYSTAAVNRAAFQFGRIAVAGSWTDYQRGGAQVTGTFVDTLGLSQRPDTVAVSALPGSLGNGAVSNDNLARGANLPLEFVGKSWCSTAQWASFRPFRLTAF